ncbi:hypothetical protein L1987_25368 [Smallanthus sonchifolius]|uniref:Uncharacterized protein n=1 Tax=Smallanthus sonchifolius TaxID=185202 RepID=A0ACB9IPG9_9ASTR|nr:hypothetical protein L1987_25368 [Smallanthus sonchifolius]
MEMLTDSVGDFFPWLSPLIDVFSGWNSRVEKCFSNLDAYIETILAEHQNRTISDDDKDFVHALVELSTIENAAGYRLTKEDVKALIMNRKRTETRYRKNDILENGGERDTKIASASPLLIPHESLRHCQIGGYDVFPGTTVLVNGWAIGRDPETWGENAAEFYPERFENLEVEYGGGSYEMVPFGGGRRPCPAMNLTPTVIEFTIANLLYWFDWEVPDEVKNEDLNMIEKEDSLVLRKKLPLYLIPIKHMWED